MYFLNAATSKYEYFPFRSRLANEIAINSNMYETITK